jgi:hypothetical protein
VQRHSGTRVSVPPLLTRKLVGTLPWHRCAVRLCGLSTLSVKWWKDARAGCAPVRSLPSYGHPQSVIELESIGTIRVPVNRSVVENYMKYIWMSEAGLAIECQCISERYLLSAIESRSPMEDPVQPVPRLRDVNARDPGGLKSQFMRSAKRRVRDGAASSP